LFNNSLNETDQLFTWLYNKGKLFCSLYKTGKLFCSLYKTGKLDEQRINDTLDRYRFVQSLEFVISNKIKKIGNAVIKKNLLF
jgi:hypothetical protein